MQKGGRGRGTAGCSIILLSLGVNNKPVQVASAKQSFSGRGFPSHPRESGAQSAVAVCLLSSLNTFYESDDGKTKTPFKENTET